MKPFSVSSVPSAQNRCKYCSLSTVASGRPSAVGNVQWLKSDAIQNGIFAHKLANLASSTCLSVAAKCTFQWLAY